MSDLGIRLAQNVEQEEEEDQWRVFGRRVPKQEAVFFSQVILIYTVVITCILNLSLTKDNSNLWTALLSSCLGYILPSPTIKSSTARNFVEKATVGYLTPPRTPIIHHNNSSSNSSRPIRTASCPPNNVEQ